MNFSIDVENIKCGGCANSIRKGLIDDPRVESVEVDIEQGRVVVEGDEQARPDLVRALAQMGYPETGSVEGMRAAAAKAKSFVSCAIGRMEKEK